MPFRLDVVALAVLLALPSTVTNAQGQVGIAFAEAGPHWHEHSCGWASREAAAKAAEIKCDPSTSAAPDRMRRSAVLGSAGNRIRGTVTLR